MDQKKIGSFLKELRKEKLIKTEQRYRYYGEKSSLLYKILYPKGQ